MSIEALNWAFQQRVTPMARKFVLVVLANYADEQHSCFPGQETISGQIGASVETVRRALKDLESMELIRREKRFRENGNRTSDRYFLPVNVTTGQSDQRSMSGPPPVNLRSTTGQIAGAEPSGEPKGNQKSGRGKPSRATSLPASFEITEGMQVWAQEKAPGIDLNHETEKFCDWHQSKGSTRTDWTAAWRIWIQKAVEYRNANPAPAPRASIWGDTMAPKTQKTPVKEWHHNELNEHQTGYAIRRPQK